MSRTNEKRTTLQEHEDANVKVSYFWAGKDKLIPWDKEVSLPNAWIHSKVRVDLLEFTEEFEGLGKTMDFKVLQLYINDEFIGELFDIDQTEKVLKCDVVVGAG